MEEDEQDDTSCLVSCIKQNVDVGGERMLALSVRRFSTSDINLVCFNKVVFRTILCPLQVSSVYRNNFLTGCFSNVPAAVALRCKHCANPTSVRHDVEIFHFSTAESQLEHCSTLHHSHKTAWTSAPTPVLPQKCSERLCLPPAWCIDDPLHLVFSCACRATMSSSEHCRAWSM